MERRDRQMDPNKERAKENMNTSPGFFGELLDHEAPIIVCDCMAFIRNKGLYDVGVFRVPGNQDMVSVLKKKYNDEFCDKDAKENNSTSILNNHDPSPNVNDIASLLKSFFKDLKEPLIPVTATEEMVRAVRENEDEKQQAKELSKIVKTIPSPNRECLGFLISFLREICTFKKFNQMSAENLATCFVLSIMGGSDAFDQLYLLGNGAIVIKKLITKSVNLYMPSVHNVKRNTKYKDVVPNKPPVAGESNGAPTNQGEGNPNVASNGKGFNNGPPGIPGQPPSRQMRTQTAPNGPPGIQVSSGTENTGTWNDNQQSRKPKRPNRKFEGLPSPVHVGNPGNFNPPQNPNVNVNSVEPIGTPKHRQKGRGKTSGNRYDRKGNKMRAKNPTPDDAFPTYPGSDGNIRNNMTKSKSDDEEPFPDMLPPNTFRQESEEDSGNGGKPSAYGYSRQVEF